MKTIAQGLKGILMNKYITVAHVGNWQVLIDDTVAGSNTFEIECDVRILDEYQWEHVNENFDVYLKYGKSYWYWHKAPVQSCEARKIIFRVESKPEIKDLE